MPGRIVNFVVLGCWSVAATTAASGVDGKITVAPRLEKKAPPQAIYDLRGAAAVVKPEHTGETGGQIGRVAIWLEGKGSPQPAPISTNMQQEGQRLTPDLLIIPVGSKVGFPNLDPIFHNIFSLSKTKSFDLGYYPEGKTRDVVFDKPGIVQVYCHVHPGMYGVIVVTDSPWSARPARDGTFSWSDVRPGKYVLNVWQRSTGTIRKTVIVPETGMAHVELRLPEEQGDH